MTFFGTMCEETPERRTGPLVTAICTLQPSLVQPRHGTYTALRNAASDAGRILTARTLIAKKPIDAKAEYLIVSQASLALAHENAKIGKKR